mmetsp:Transcript_2897/g.6852  ORF Transcript_2897/g.6852 Transcript_2897/m.6852 type:complete len:142 (+) Transcript_2897:150-575(+)
MVPVPYSQHVIYPLGMDDAGRRTRARAATKLRAHTFSISAVRLSTARPARRRSLRAAARATGRGATRTTAGLQLATARRLVNAPVLTLVCRAAAPRALATVMRVSETSVPAALNLPNAATLHRGLAAKRTLARRDGRGALP